MLVADARLHGHDLAADDHRRVDLAEGHAQQVEDADARPGGDRLDPEAEVAGENENEHHARDHDREQHDDPDVVGYRLRLLRRSVMFLVPKARGEHASRCDKRLPNLDLAEYVPLVKQGWRLRVVLRSPDRDTTLCSACGAVGRPRRSMLVKRAHSNEGVGSLFRPATVLKGWRVGRKRLPTPLASPPKCLTRADPRMGRARACRSDASGRRHRVRPARSVRPRAARRPLCRGPRRRGPVGRIRSPCLR